ncbi:unnamed protein product [Rhizoctonia solani]|uniref:NodB homology domain-containing protein n=1 Tax=Rhizoctonia solani TaxID=456999 RepID=A0A8H3HH15_9AGAM|nr:unnamed protein product [Rhizoctonia solani]
MLRLIHSVYPLTRPPPRFDNSPLIIIMHFSIAQFAALASTLFGVTQASSTFDSRATASVVRKCQEPNTVAITFDDGPYKWTTELVDMLDKYGAKGTFFVNGNNYGCIYREDNAKSLNYLIEKGHQLASHTWGHAHLSKLTGDKLNSEFSKTNDAIKKITGRTPAFMRPPYGDYNDEVVEKAANNGQTVVIWDFDSKDSIGATVAQSKSYYDKTLSEHPGSILTLNHETIETTAHEVIPYALKKIQEKGYRMVTVAECLGMEPYQAITSPSSRDVNLSPMPLSNDIDAHYREAGLARSHAGETFPTTTPAPEDGIHSLINYTVINVAHSLQWDSIGFLLSSD